MSEIAVLSTIVPVTDSNLLPIVLCAHMVLGFDFFFLVCRHWWFSGSGAAEVSSSEMQWILISYYVVV
jgi:hypothetical protein